MSTLDLDVFDGGTSVARTTLEIVPALPSHRYVVSSRLPELHYIGANDEGTIDFVTRNAYTIDIITSNVAPDTTIQFKAYMPSYQNGNPVWIDITTSSQSDPNYQLCSISPIGVGATNSEGRTRWAVTFENYWRFNGENARMSHKIQFSIKAGNTPELFYQEHGVIWNPLTIGNYIDYANEDTYMVVPLGDYGSWIDLDMVSAGGGGCGAGIGYQNGGDAGRVYLWLMDPDMIASTPQQLGALHTTDITNKANGYSIGMLTGGGGGIGNGGFGDLDYGGTAGIHVPRWVFGDYSIPWANVGSRKIVNWLQLGYEDLVTLWGSSGQPTPHEPPGNPRLGGAGHIIYPGGSSPYAYGKGGNGGMRPATNNSGQTPGGGSGAHWKLRISFRRKRSSAGYPMPPILLSFNPAQFSPATATTDIARRSQLNTTGSGGNGPFTNGQNGAFGLGTVAGGGFFTNFVD